MKANVYLVVKEIGVALATPIKALEVRKNMLSTLRPLKLCVRADMYDLDVIPAAFEIFGIAHSMASWHIARSITLARMGLPWMPPRAALPRHMKRMHREYTDYSRYSREELVSFLHHRDLKIEQLSDELAKTRRE